MSIPAPSQRLSTANIELLPAGKKLHRIHRLRMLSHAFNPCQGDPTRFAPIADRDGACVPSLYAGGTFECVAYETIFHDIPVEAERKSVPLTLASAGTHGTLRPRRAIRLASLRAPDLLRWNILRNSLIATSTGLYKQTAAWAKAIHDGFPNVEGLVWTSNRCDPDDAYLFFGDRVHRDDFENPSVRDGRSDDSFLADVRRAGLRAGIRIRT